MRTTVRLNDGLLRQVKAEAAKRGETVTALIERGLRLVLSASHQPRARITKLPASRATGGTQAGVDLNDSADMLDARRWMILPDVNILFYAFRIDSRRHSDYHGWLEDTLNGDAPFGISSQTLASLIRISTHPRIYVNPSTLEEALSFCPRLSTRLAARLFIREIVIGVIPPACAVTPGRGNLVQDAWFAALAIESGCEWITTDGDYARFPRLRWRDPF